MNKPGLGHGLVNQTQMSEVGRQLICDARRSRRKLSEPFQIEPPKLCYLCWRCYSGISGQKLRRQSLYPRPLARAEHSRMARQHLFNQAGTRTRHTDDEDRELRCAIGRFSQLLGREVYLLCSKKGKSRSFIVGEQSAIQAVAALQMHECTLVVSKIVVGFEQCKMQLDLLRCGQGFFPSREGCQVFKTPIMFLVGLHLSPGPIITRDLRCEICGMRESLGSFLIAAELFQDGAISCIVRRVAWIYSQSLGCAPQRIILSSECRKRLGAPKQGSQHARLKGQGSGKEVEGDFVFFQAQIYLTQTFHDFRIPGRERQCVGQRRKGRLQISQCGLCQPQRVPGIRHIRSMGEGRRSFNGCFRRIAQLQEQQTEMLADLRIVWCGRGRLLQQLSGLPDAAGLNAQECKVVQSASVTWRSRQYSPILAFGFSQAIQAMEPDGRFKEGVHIGLVPAQLSLIYKRILAAGDCRSDVLVLFLFPDFGVADTVNRVSARTIRMSLRLRLPAVAVLCMPFLVSSAPAAPSLIPLPASVESGAGHFVLDKRVGINCAEVRDTACSWIADYFSDLLKRTRGVALQRNGSSSILLRRDASLQGEAYHLRVFPDGVEISAGSDAGLLYGAVTLWQLATSQDTDRIEIPLVDIKDAPRFSWRGVLLDTARHYQTPEFIRHFIDDMALHKLNVLQWHLTDDQGWRLDIKKYPRLTRIGAWRRNKRGGRYGGFYDQDQVREIVAYAAQRNVTIVPEIEMPGHATAAIVAYPKLASTKRPPKVVSGDWGIFPNLYNVDDGTFTFLENVLTEVMALFPSKYIHVGGDEAPKDQWNTSASIQQKMRILGITDAKALQGYFTARIGKFLEAHGRHLIGWDEILEGNPPPSAAVMSWHAIGGAGEAAERGHDVVLSPAPQLYLDYCQALREGEPTCRGPQTTLHDVYAFDPTPKGVMANHLIGIQANIWTEHLPTGDAVSYAAFPRLAAFAEIAWSPEAAHNWNDFLGRLSVQFERYKALGIQFSSAAFAVDVSASPTAEGMKITLSNQTNYGTIHYTLDGTMPESSSPIYTASLRVRLPVTLSARTFDGTHPLSGLNREYLDSKRALRRNSYTMEQCTNDLPLAQKGRGGAVVMVNVMNPCWIYRGLDLTHVHSFDISVTSMPFNYQIGKDIAKIPLYSDAARLGELEVHLDDCSGQRLAKLKLAPNASVLHAAIAPHMGIHDLCFVFARRKVDPVWAIDWVQPIEKE